MAQGHWRQHGRPQPVHKNLGCAISNSMLPPPSSSSPSSSSSCRCFPACFVVSWWFWWGQAEWLLGEPCLHCSAVQWCALRCVAWAKLSYPLACCCVRVARGGQPTGATWMKEGFAMRLLHFSSFSFPSLPFCPPSTCNKASQILPQQIPPTPISTPPSYLFLLFKLQATLPLLYFSTSMY
jgi:hypothetical protein